MTLLKKNDPKRKWRSFKRHALLLLKTFVLASVTTTVWYELWSNGYRLAEDDKDIIIGAIITSLGVAYGVSLSWIFAALLETYRKLMVAVLEKDEHTFMLWRDERMPIAVHLSVGIPSLLLLYWIGGVSYRHAFTGGASVFGISFMFIFFWFVAKQIENPIKSEWFKERIDPEWLIQDVDKYFHLGEHDKKFHPHD